MERIRCFLLLWDLVTFITPCHREAGRQGGRVVAITEDNTAFSPRILRKTDSKKCDGRWCPKAMPRIRGRNLRQRQSGRRGTLPPPRAVKPIGGRTPVRPLLRGLGTECPELGGEDGLPFFGFILTGRSLTLTQRDFGIWMLFGGQWPVVLVPWKGDPHKKFVSLFVVVKLAFHDVGYPFVSASFAFPSTVIFHR